MNNIKYSRAMAGKVTDMSKIKQLLRLHQSGETNRQIAKKTGIDRGTVNDYIRKLKSGGMDMNELLSLDEPVLESKFIAGTAAYTDKRFEDFQARLPWFEKELGRKHVTRSILWQEYLSLYPSGYRYTQFCHHLNQQLIARKPSAVLIHIAGEKLMVDFCGDRLEYVDRKTGEVFPVYVFIACLPYSDYTFTLAVHHQTTADFLYALSCCLKHLGGSPQILVPDNLKAAVVKADRYEPELNRLMADFANHYNFTVLPARAASPRDKAKCENHVRIIYSRVYAKLRNERFYSLDELNRALFDKTMEHNQTRMQRKDYSRREKFLADEKKLLILLPETDFELKYYAELRAGKDNFVYLARDRHFYSVPYIYIGEKVQVIYTRKLVKLFCRNEQIAVHERTIGFGHTFIREHLCSQHRHYNDRSPDYYIEKAKRKSKVLGELITAVFAGPKVPEVYYKTCDALLSLYRKTELSVFEKACQTALSEGIYSCRFIRNMIENKTLSLETQDYKPLPDAGKNLRGKQYYK
jgi:transposase